MNREHKRKGENLLIPAFVFILVLILFKTVFYIGIVPTPSMEPTLKEGQIIVGLRIGFNVQNGDIIVFQHNGFPLVKRVAYSPGEPVPESIDARQLTVPEDSFYVLGDNLEESNDSRLWEWPYVQADDLVAKIFILAAPDE